MDSELAQSMALQLDALQSLPDGTVCRTQPSGPTPDLLSLPSLCRYQACFKKEACCGPGVGLGTRPSIECFLAAMKPWAPALYYISQAWRNLNTQPVERQEDRKFLSYRASSRAAEATRDTVLKGKARVQESHMAQRVQESHVAQRDQERHVAQRNQESHVAQRVQESHVARTSTQFKPFLRLRQGQL